MTIKSFSLRIFFVEDIHLNFKNRIIRNYMNKNVTMPFLSNTILERIT